MMMDLCTLSKMRKIYLHGHLKDKHPQVIEVEASTVAEAIQSLTQIPTLADGAPWPVTIKGVETDAALFSPTDLEEIHVYPRLGGAGGRNGLTQVLIGIAMVGLAVFLGPGAFAAGSFLGGMGITQGALILTGAMMALGGVVQMLTPMPEFGVDSQDNGEESKFLSSAVNTVRINTPIPLAYGTVKLGGHYLSYDVDAVVVGSGGNSDALDDLVDGPSLTVHDKPSVQTALIDPIFSSPTAGPSNNPTENWQT